MEPSQDQKLLREQQNSAAMDSDFFATCFLYKIQKDRCRKQDSNFAKHFRFTGIYKDFCILYSPFWEEMFIMDNSWPALRQKWQKYKAVHNLLL